jgi:hypothetical protein
MDKNKEKNITGDEQAAYAGTNTNKYRQPAEADRQDNPMQDEEAQNVTDASKTMSREDAERARNKASERRLEEE